MTTGSGERGAASALRDFALVGLGGALGTLVRYLMSASWGGSWLGAPGGSLWTTFAINVSGAFALGAAVALLAIRHPRAQLFLGTGVLGGYTTYSLLAADISGLALGGSPWIALALGLGTVVIGLAGSAAGSALGSALRARRDERRGSAGGMERSIS